MNETKKCYYLRTKYQGNTYNDFFNFTSLNEPSDILEYMLKERAKKLAIDYNLLIIEQFSLV